MITLRLYVWLDDGTQVHVSLDNNPDSRTNLVKKDLGGFRLVDEGPPMIADVTLLEWIAERHALI
jgi:hypothetical protein